MNTAPECLGPGEHVSKTVHNFSSDMTVAHTTSLAERRKEPASFIASVIETAPVISGYKAPAAGAVLVRFLGAQFVVPRPPGCIAGRYIPGCPTPLPNGSLPAKAAALPTDSIGLVEAFFIPTEGQCFAVVTIFFPASVDDMMTSRKPMYSWLGLNFDRCSRIDQRHAGPHATCAMLVVGFMFVAY